MEQGIKIIPIPDCRTDFQNWNRRCVMPVKLVLESNNGKSIDVWADTKDLENIGVYIGT